ncbi:MAG TPA: hypothetical protein PKC85_04045 [Bacteroidia bacterium]|jgi:peptidoglycan biosynthesis protein MviN/MurJ (putative lipid II flippase)|nr:hypothetical protein [Bacteroidia bacterium]HMU18997.1 hypothetical protein [Bacteroidia bacterium]
MKKIMFVSGAVAASLTTLGVLFKTMYWPGANVMLVFGLGMLAFIFIPITAKYYYNNHSVKST